MEGTRHNAGMALIDHLARLWNVPLILDSAVSSHFGRKTLSLPIIDPAPVKRPSNKRNLETPLSDLDVQSNQVSEPTFKIDLILAKPHTFMNVSGLPISHLYSRFRPHHLLIVHDELDKKLGRSSLKHGGSANGHNGLKSIFQHLGTAGFERLRVGIGRPEGSRGRRERDVRDYVLDKFSLDEERVLSDVAFPQSVDLILKHIRAKSLPAVSNQTPRKNHE